MKKALSIIAKINEIANRFIVNELNKYGIKELAPSHGDILAALYSEDNLTMKDIADKIHRTRPTVTVLVDKLEKLGFVKKVISNSDKRYTYISLTKKGNEFRPVFEEISNNLNKKLYKDISDDVYCKLEDLLMLILKNVKE